MSDASLPNVRSNFGVREDEIVDLVIDGPRLFSMTRNLGSDLDYRELLRHFETNCRLRRSHYYTSIVENEEGAYNPIRPLVDWLGFNGFRTVVKEAREIIDTETQRRSVVGGTMVEMAIDMLELCEFTDHIVLFTNSGDLTYAVEKAQARGTRVTVVSLLSAQHRSHCNPLLRRQADRFIDLAEVMPGIARPPRTTAQPGFNPPSVGTDGLNALNRQRA